MKVYTASLCSSMMLLVLFTANTVHLWAVTNSNFGPVINPNINLDYIVYGCGCWKNALTYVLCAIMQSIFVVLIEKH